MYMCTAYMCTNFAGIMDELRTEQYDLVQEFIHRNCFKGYNCLIKNKSTNLEKVIYADDYISNMEE